MCYLAEEEEEEEEEEGREHKKFRPDNSVSIFLSLLLSPLEFILFYFFENRRIRMKVFEEISLIPNSIQFGSNRRHRLINGGAAARHTLLWLINELD